ncbi:hypothetical protein N0V82_002361 [Gnomoniopsis sp. IMI 355080]|nr:hypothetical protein N0V82_002361 [Gnomoniopsis sp. IMI 355080]
MPHVTNKQVDYMVSNFTAAVVKHLHFGSGYGPIDAFAQDHALEDIRAALETFCEAIGRGGTDTYMQLSTEKIIRPTQNSMSIVILRRATRKAGDYFSTTRPEIPLLPVSLLEVDTAEIVNKFPLHEAFSRLTQEIGQVLERYTCLKLDSIRLRTSLGLRRNGLNFEKKYFRVEFRLDWDLLGFLKTHYEDGAGQDINGIAAVTGTMHSAILCSVSEYLENQWPECSRTLIDAISLARSQPKRRSARLKSRQVCTASSISLDPALSTVHAEGPEEFIVSLAQQIAWLSGACGGKLDRLSYAYTGFTLGDATAEVDIDAVFNLDVKIKPCNHQHIVSNKPGSEDVRKTSDSCWKSLLGPVVIISGFPIPQRPDGARGLEISVPAMSAMAGIPDAITFEGGFVFKGRHHALVPVQTFGSSMQWHMLDTYPEKLDWANIRNECPNRVKGHINSFAKHRSFVGWYPDAEDFIGRPPPSTDKFDFASVKFSSARAPSRFVEFDKLEVGFAQWGAMNLGLTMGRNEGYRAQRPTDYESLLEDASQLPVILYDTQLKRARQTDAENLILHILLHQQSKGKFAATMPNVVDKVATELDTEGHDN